MISRLIDDLYEELVIRKLKENQVSKLLTLRDVISEHIFVEEELNRSLKIQSLINTEKEHRPIVNELNDLIVFSRRSEYEICKIEKIIKLMTEHQNNEDRIWNSVQKGLG